MNVILISSSAPDNLWGEVLLTAYFLQNRIPHKKTGNTPYELWRGYQPNLKYLRVWGCLAKVMLLDPKKRKIGSKTSDCMFLGYVEHSVAYRFLVLKSDVIEHNTIVETKNVEFFEHIFPLKVLDPKKRKIGSKTSDCMFLGYAEHSVAYRFLVLKSDVIEHNTIVETKNVEFFKHIFPLKVSETLEQSIVIIVMPCVKF